MNAVTENNGRPDIHFMQRSVTPLGAWALSFGCAVGWGAFMMPGNVFLPVAGPFGTVIGFLLGTIVMLIIGVNYYFLMKECPDAGGAFSYIKSAFDYDHGFVGAWFLLLTYIAIVWANATALPLIGRFLLGDVFQFGFSYNIAGFDVYFGEVLLSVGAIVITGILCIRVKAALFLQIVMAVLLCCGVLICAVAVFSRPEAGKNYLSPGFAPGKNPLTGIFTILAMGPWAFVGFESISHSAEEFTFPVKKTLAIMAGALICGAAAYTSLTLIAASTLPQGFESWPEYMEALGRLDGMESAPVFYAVRTALGPAGTPVLVITVLGGVLTGLIGNSIAASRLIYTMAKDGMMPRRCARLNRRGVPKNSVLLIVCVSVVIPFLGRTTAGWIVDVTTVGSAIVYAYVSACALRHGRSTGSRPVMATGLIGLGISLVFLLYYLIPNLLAVSAMGRESYLILATWSVIGLVVFRFLLLHDKTNRLGHSAVVWIVLLSLILFTSLVWMRQASSTIAQKAIDNVYEHFCPESEDSTHSTPAPEEKDSGAFLDAQKTEIDNSLKRNSLLQSVYVILSLAALISIYSIIHKREKRIEREKILAQEASRSKTSFLSRMSHEIRTPMNAIIGLDAIALMEPDLSPRTRDQLEKIGSSARHLLGLINDILDMSRIESGRMTLNEEEFSFQEFLDQINVIVNGQCMEKGLVYECHVIGKTEDTYIGDSLKLKQVLINILGNAVKFTEPPGEITFTVAQAAEYENHCALRFVMKDTGIGMSEDYIPKIFDAFTQENAGTVNSYGSTGLGMAISRNLVEMMNGEITVESEKGVGTVFTVLVTVRKSTRVNAGPDRDDQKEALPEAGNADSLFAINEPLPDQAQLEGMHVLVAEDVELNAEILTDLLEMEGVRADHAWNGKEAVEFFEQHEPGFYQAILMDLRMPVLDGLGAAKAIRELPREDAKSIPIIALSANAFDEDVQRSLQAGLNAHLSKPIDADKLFETLRRVAVSQETGGTD